MAVRDLYRLRFGIESSYRQLGRVRPRTSTTNGVVRLLWVAIGLILRNAWVRFRTTRQWTLAAACPLLWTESLKSMAGNGPPDIIASNRNNPRSPT